MRFFDTVGLGFSGPRIPVFGHALTFRFVMIYMAIEHSSCREYAFSGLYSATGPGVETAQSYAYKTTCSDVCDTRIEETNRIGVARTISRIKIRAFRSDIWTGEKMSRLVIYLRSWICLFLRNASASV